MELNVTLAPFVSLLKELSFKCILGS